MQLMGDALTILGSRLGIAWDPGRRNTYLVRHSEHPGLPFHINAGITIGDRTTLLPLTPAGEIFEFLEQKSTPSTMALSGTDPETGLHLKLTVRMPFCPRDVVFSTTPVLYFELALNRIAAPFRWVSQPKGFVSGKLFLEFGGEGFSLETDSTGAYIHYSSPARYPKAENQNIQNPCRDRLTMIAGNWNGEKAELEFSLDPGESSPIIVMAWSVYDAPVLKVLGETCPFKYTTRFRSLDEVSRWAVSNHPVVVENSQKVDGLITGHTLGESVNHLLVQTLHAWLLNTWYVVRPDGQDWFTVWEGSCYFHSTVDVEFTQGPFYLTLWPELLELELDQWTHFTKDGATVLGPSGAGTLFLSHDMGSHADCSGQHYPHEMEVEENTNYIILAYVHWRRTGNDRILRQHHGTIRKMLDFILACDTTGNGIPDQGCANTIDDASPAVQFGKEQIYLGVKAMVACDTGLAMLEHLGETGLDKYYDFSRQALATLEPEGWLKDHYVVTLTRTMDGAVDPWTGEVKSGPLEGWDAYHIYTANGLALPAMVGYTSGLSREKLQQDLLEATSRTMVKYGCRHSSYIPEAKSNDDKLLGLATTAPKVGWVSMNMLRDIAAAYHGIDLMTLAEKYWDWQLTTNTQKIALFFETFYGNNLHFYPRGVAIYGYLDAAAGFTYDAVSSKKTFAPVRATVTVPLLIFADWKQGTTPMVRTMPVDKTGIRYCLEGLA